MANERRYNVKALVNFSQEKLGWAIVESYRKLGCGMIGWVTIRQSVNPYRWPTVDGNVGPTVCQRLVLLGSVVAAGLQCKPGCYGRVG
ncbi:hypothetical protein AVEN_78635-1 [Araneus ventricosus]|uniref:Uncharacterized protein n=1 Tax=Araneus ventricosus TaxID=182803 RepID=A0A4Y2KAT6_ARAVE|nr:hypothetical protein AVEN_78635-1 [Araneus ventricosus]